MWTLLLTIGTTLTTHSVPADWRVDFVQAQIQYTEQSSRWVCSQTTLKALQASPPTLSATAARCERDTLFHNSFE